MLVTVAGAFVSAGVRMKKLMLIVFGGAALLLVAAVVLFLKNPAKSDFEAFIAKEDEKRREAMIKEKKGVGLVTGLLGEIPRTAAESIEREEYYLCSVYKRKYSVLGIESSSTGLPETEKYLGIFNRFFKIE